MARAMSVARMQVVLGAGGDLAERRAPRPSGRRAAPASWCSRSLLRHQVAILERQLHRVAERAEPALRRSRSCAPGRVRAARVADNRVAGLVDTRRCAARASLMTRFFSRPAIEPVDRLVEVAAIDGRLVVPRGEQRGLVDEVREIGAGKSGRPRRDHLAGPRSSASFTCLRVDPENRLAAAARRACRRAPADRSGRGGAAPGRALPAGWSRP